MNRPVELVDGVWVLHNAVSGRNTGILVGDKSATIIDPTEDKIDMSIIDEGLVEQGRMVESVVFTHDAFSEDISRWSDVPHIRAETFEPPSPLPVSMDGWEVVPLSKEAPGRLALYNVRARLLFCGKMLADSAASEAIPMLEGSSRRYVDALGMVKDLDVKLLVPSYGSIATGKRSIRKRIEVDRSYVYDVRRLVIESIVSNVSMERVLTVTADLHEDFPFLQEHLANIRAVWAELSIPNI